MKPDSQPQISRVEQAPIAGAAGVEYWPNMSSSPEKNPDVQAERSDGMTEKNAAGIDTGTPVALPTPVVVSDDKTTTTIVDAPDIAKDDDLIEKEWVKKAKKIVSLTKDNPKKREEEVSKLQIDYLNKRFGRQVGAADK